MASHLYRTDSGDQETLYSSYQSPYYVQSPSTVSHANSADAKSTHGHGHSHDHSSTTLMSFLHYSSPTRSDTTNILLMNKPDTAAAPAASRFTLSRYSSYGSTSSFLNDKNKLSIINVDHHDQGGAEDEDDHVTKKVVNRLVIVDKVKGCKGDDGYEDEEGGWEGEEEEVEEEGEGNYHYIYYWWRWWWWRYCSFKRSDSLAWFCLQLTWRLFFSFGVALLVFYVATKPPPPQVSIKVAGVPEFVLAEGVDYRGVTTKILTLNCSMNLVIDNKSKVFGLHVHPPTLELSFGRLPIAMSRGPGLYAEANGLSWFQLNVGTRDKPMYGAGRNMEDMLDSGKGLPIIVRVRLSSNFRMVWNLVKPKYHRQALCFLVLEKSYDKKHWTQAFHSNCSMIS